MLRGMVFVDHMNFDIAVRQLYKSKNEIIPKLDYNTMFIDIVKQVNNTDYLKTFIFAPQPDDFLMQDERLLNYYKWVSGLRSMKNTDVIFGRYIARPVNPDNEMNIDDHSTYYKVEKGTDINLGINALSKAQFNSYDIAFVLSADTDYIDVYRKLKELGKIVVLVIVEGQYNTSLRQEVDQTIVLKKSFFDSHKRETTLYV